MRTEKHLWKYMRPRLLGRGWRRVESRTSEGVLDAFGFYKGQTIWIELKVGKPDAKRLEPGQVTFITECLSEGVPVWVVFAHNGVLKWFPGMPYGDPVSPPAFYGKTQPPPRRRPVLRPTGTCRPSPRR